MTLINRIRLTVWQDKSVTGEVPVGRNAEGQPDWARLSGRSIGLILGTVKGTDWETWTETIKTAKGQQTVTRYRSVRSWRMTVDESVVGRIDLLKVEREDPPATEVVAALNGAVAVAAPVRRVAAVQTVAGEADL